MTDLKFTGMKTTDARALQRGGLDANGQLPSRAVSDGKSKPCRHCLQMIEENAEYLVFAYRPFSTIQPYAEMGPVFLHAKECESFDANGNTLPDVLEDKPSFIARGYGGRRKNCLWQRGSDCKGGYCITLQGIVGR